MNLGLLLLNGEMKDLVATARRAEAAGFSGVYVAEVYRSAWALLTAIAAATERISLGPYVINAYARSPLLAGISAIDFNEFANGRLVLGVGGGNREVNEVWQGIPHARVLTKLREYVQILQRMARCPAGEALHFEGKIHRMQWTPVVQPLATPFTVFLAAVFPDMLRVAATVADGIAGGATLSPDYLKNVMQPRAAAHAAAARANSGSASSGRPASRSAAPRLCAAAAACGWPRPTAASQARTHAASSVAAPSASPPARSSPA